MGDRVRVALVGSGFIGRVHARAARVADASLVVVSASTPERSAAAAAELGAERPAASWEEAVSDPEVEVVHLCTPNHLHLPQALAALEAGKHVICEKPLATGLEHARRIADAATAAERVLAIPFVYRYYPTVREARERVATGASGPVRVVHGTYLQDWLAGADDTNWRVDAALGGRSRAFADIGSHWCDLAEFVTGHRIRRLVATISTVVPERAHHEHQETFGGPASGAERVAVATEDVALVLFETDRGARGSVVVSQISPGRKNRLWLEVDAADAAVAFDQEQPEVLWQGTRRESALVVRDPSTLSAPAAHYASLPAGHPQGYHDCFDAFVADAYAAVRGSSPDGLPVGADGVRAAAITGAVLESAAAGGWVEVEQ